MDDFAYLASAVAGRYTVPVQPRYRDKLIGVAAFEKLREQLRLSGQTLSHCHGCFDIVHPGHVRHLHFAADQGDRLVVSLTPDRFVNKGPNRPMFNERLRAENLAALEFVDWVIVNDAPTSAELLGRIQPDRYIKGAEYEHNLDPRFEQERAIVEQHGGKVVFSPNDIVYSSSAIIESLRSIAQAAEPESTLFSLASEHDLSSFAIADCFERARGKRVLVLSECIVDQYAHCQHPEVAQEHPMLSLIPDREEQFDGGGAVIAKHLAAMGLEVTLCTPIGHDPETMAFVERIESRGIRVERISCAQPLPRKLRYLVRGEKMMKIDSSTRYTLPESFAQDLIDRIVQAGGYDAMFIADFGLGLFANRLASNVIDGVRHHVGMILGDVSGRRAQLSEMRGADVLCPCEVELRQTMHADDEPLSQLATRAMEITGARTICVTRAAQGMVIFDRESGVHALPALCAHPVDVLGCGDALLTAMGAALLGGADRVQAGYIGSLAAAIEGETLGNIEVGSSQIVSRSRQLGASLLPVIDALPDSAIEHTPARPAPTQTTL